MTMFVNQDLCRGCGACVGVCPNSAITMKDREVFINKEKCTSCQVFIKACPTGALQLLTSISPAIFRKPEIIEVIKPDTSVGNYSKQPTWSQTILPFVGQYVFPHLANVLSTFLVRKLSPPIQQNTSSFTNSVGTRPY